MSVLPSEIINEILVRLPVKPLLRFRSVSKLWYALINDPYFIKIHLERSITTKSNRSLYLSYMCTLFSFNLKDLRISIKLEYPDDHKGSYIMGSCNGILLIQNRVYVALFNPAIRQYRVLPSFPVDYPRDDSTVVDEQYGFGYDSVSDDYKVIRVIDFKRYSSEIGWNGRLEAKIFSLRSNSWREIEILHYCWPPRFRRLNLHYYWQTRGWGVHFNGRLHNLTNTIRNASTPNSIVSFDLGTEKCHLVPLPDLEKSYNCISVEVFDGNLCVVASYGDLLLSSYRTDIWVMKVYGEKESWLKLFTYRADDYTKICPLILSAYAKICPLALSKNGEEVLSCFDDKTLIWYDPERKIVRIVPYFGRPSLLYDDFGVESNPSYVDVGVESLVPLG